MSRSECGDRDHALGRLGERITADGEIAAERDVLASLTILDGAASGVCRSHGLGVIREAEDVDLELG